MIREKTGHPCFVHGSLRRCRTGKEGQKGFTLLELIISIFMLVIIVAIISGALRVGTRSVAAGEKRVNAMERLRNSISVINAQIQSAAPLVYDDEGIQKSYFSGTRESLQFSSYYSIWGGQKGYVVVSYQVGIGLSGKRCLNATEHLIGVEATQETMLLDGFDDIAFEYLQQGLTVGEPNTWVPYFTTEASIPIKIRLYLLSGFKEQSIILPVRARPALGGV